MTLGAGRAVHGVLTESGRRNPPTRRWLDALADEAADSARRTGPRPPRRRSRARRPRELSSPGHGRHGIECRTDAAASCAAVVAPAASRISREPLGDRTFHGALQFQRLAQQRVRPRSPASARRPSAFRRSMTSGSSIIVTRRLRRSACREGRPRRNACFMSPSVISRTSPSSPTRGSRSAAVMEFSFPPVRLCRRDHALRVSLEGECHNDHQVAQAATAHLSPWPCRSSSKLTVAARSISATSARSSPHSHGAVLPSWCRDRAVSRPRRPGTSIDFPDPVPIPACVQRCRQSPGRFASASISAAPCPSIRPPIIAFLESCSTHALAFVACAPNASLHPGFERTARAAGCPRPGAGTGQGNANSGVGAGRAAVTASAASCMPREPPGSRPHRNADQQRPDGDRRWSEQAREHRCCHGQDAASLL